MYFFASSYSWASYHRASYPCKLFHNIKNARNDSFLTWRQCDNFEVWLLSALKGLEKDPYCLFLFLFSAFSVLCSACSVPSTMCIKFPDCLMCEGKYQLKAKFMFDTGNLIHATKTKIFMLSTLYLPYTHPIHTNGLLVYWRVVSI